MAQLTCVVVTPEAKFLDQPADFVVLPLYDGEIGIAPGRGPLIGRLGFGEMRVRHGSKTDRYYVDGGFVQVVANVVTVLTGLAQPSRDIQEDKAREQLAKAATQRAATPELLASRDRTIAQARARIRARQRAR